MDDLLLIQSELVKSHRKSAINRDRVVLVNNCKVRSSRNNFTTDLLSLRCLGSSHINRMILNMLSTLCQDPTEFLRVGFACSKKEEGGGEGVHDEGESGLKLTVVVKMSIELN